MTASKSQLKDATFCAEAVRLYRTTHHNIEEIAAMLQTTHHTVSLALQQEMPPAEFKRLKTANYSRSKMGENNPMLGVRYAAARILRQGRAAVWNGKDYTHESRIMVAKSLGLTELPAHWEVHHIDGDKTNDTLDNFAITTHVGHQKMHKQTLGRLYKWEKEMFGTSLLQEMQATLLRG